MMVKGDSYSEKSFCMNNIWSHLVQNNPLKSWLLNHMAPDSISDSNLIFIRIRIPLLVLQSTALMPTWGISTTSLATEWYAGGAWGEGNGLLDPPTSPPSTSASSPRCTAHALPSSTSCRPTSQGRWHRLILRWSGGQCWTWRQEPWSALLPTVDTLRSREEHWS